VSLSRASMPMPVLYVLSDGFFPVPVIALSPVHLLDVGIIVHLMPSRDKTARITTTTPMM
jgi:hypothetical protein